MTLGLHRVLGLAVEERSILAVELRAGKGRIEAVHAGEFAFPEGVSLDSPARLGKALGEFLKANHFTGRSVVLGLPAKWLLTKDKSVPPTDAQTTAGMLRIQAEHDFGMALDDMTIDYANGLQGQGSRVLLAAVMRKNMDQLIAATRAAGLKVRSLTSSGMALAGALGRSNTMPALSLYLRPGAAELTVSDGKHVRAIKYLPFAAAEGNGSDKDRVATLARDIHRELALLPPRDGSSGHETFFISDAAGVDKHAVESLGAGVSLPVKRPDFAALGVTTSPEFKPDEPNRFVAAAALGVAGFNPQMLPVDFLHSRLAPPKKHLAKRYIVWGIVIGAALILIAAFTAYDWLSESQELRSLRKQVDDLKGDTQAAQTVIQRVTAARGWYDKRPKFLDCLRELTACFPAEGRIWATGLVVQKDMRGVVTGKAFDEKTILDVLGSIKSRKAFTNVSLLYMNEAAKASREVSFAIGFTFVPSD